MATLRRAVFYAIAVLVLLVGMRLGTHAGQKHAATPRANSSVPAYHPAAPAGRLAPTLAPADFRGNPVAQHAYAAAAGIAPLLYQLPCYCHCDRELGHTSLLSCYQTRHAAECAVCLMETYYAYQESRKGRSASQIRQGIIRGDWQRVDIRPWQRPLPVSHRPRTGAD